MFEIEARSASRRRSFTLLELCLCLCLISSVGGLVGVKVHHLLDEHRFQYAMGSLLSYVKRVQFLAVCYHTDLRLQFHQQGEQLFCSLQSEEPWFSRRKEPALALGKMQLQGAHVLEIYASGRISPCEKLTFRQGDRNAHLDLTTPLLIRVENKS